MKFAISAIPRRYGNYLPINLLVVVSICLNALCAVMNFTRGIAVINEAHVEVIFYNETEIHCFHNMAPNWQQILHLPMFMLLIINVLPLIQIHVLCLMWSDVVTLRIERSTNWNQLKYSRNIHSATHLAVIT